MMSLTFRQQRVWCFLLLIFVSVNPSVSVAEPLVIAASPSLRVPLEGLAPAVETTHPAVSVRLSFERGLDLRRTIAQVENEGSLAVEQRPIHLVAPGDDEL